MTGGVRSRLLKLAPVVTGLVLFAASCASNAPQDTFKPEGPAARKIDNLIVPIFGVAGIVFVLIIGGAIFIAWKFRARDDDDYNEMPKQVHGHFKAEIGWTIAPALVLLVVGALTVNLIFELAKKPSKEAVHVEVYGQQWWWEYRYDLNGDGDYTDIITANDLVIPAGREVALRIRSRDVIHSWWAPRLNGKKDAVPGRVHPLTIEADKPGEYIGQCTEFCGLSHAEMRIKVVAVTDSEYEAWTKHQQEPFQKPTTQAAINGWGAFAGQCTMCHELTGMIDPTSADDPRDATEKYAFPKEKMQVSGEAPNLLHFMTRSTFAGAKFDLRKDTPECNKLGTTWASTDEGIAKCLNRTDLESWLRNPPSMKAMHPGDTPSPESRGMPNLDLSEDQIDDLVAFLTTLK
ncbi:MAG: cytochrome c oxidase subunit II [Acidimicrobiales bacterium]|nr:cytochrome c oxidase subunit II [Acidimicrobiales bacterium]